MAHVWLIALVAILVMLGCAEANKKHHYNEGDEVELLVNNIGPFSNPTETYEYYSLPFCQPPEGIQKKSQKLGAKLEGDRAMNTIYSLPFKTNIKDKKVCDLPLSQEKIDQFKKAIDKYYYYEMIYDDLAVFGFVGNKDPETEEAAGGAAEGVVTQPKYYFFRTIEFNIEYNEDQVIRINISRSPMLHELRDGDFTPIEMTYSANWFHTDIPFEKRKEFQYKDPLLAQQLEIHWLSIMNSIVLVILLTGFLAIIVMRVLKSDYARYARAEDEDDDQEDYGWKLIHGDVFRFPPQKNLFCALIGNGVQFLTMLAGILLLSLFGIYYPNNGGNLYVTAITLYAITAGLGGFVAGRSYKQFNGERWAWNIILTAAIFAIPFVLVVTYVNSIALHYKVTAALPFLTIFEVLSIYVLVGFPLTVLGGIAGRRLAGPFEASCRTKNFPREIPPITWYRRLPFQMMMAGFLPFSSIYIELFYIYSSVWGRTYYTLFGILCIVFLILIIVTACITVALTYFQLSMEDHRWWWNAFINGGSTGIFIYVYSIFYYLYRSEMLGGVLQGSFYFSYMLVVCYFFFIILGTVGYFASLAFVRRIYMSIHSD